MRGLRMLPLSQLPTTATTTDEFFRCERFNCGMQAGRCVERQMRREAEAKKFGHDPINLAACNPSKCEQGASLRAAMPNHVPQTSEARRRAAAIEMARIRKEKAEARERAYREQQARVRAERARLAAEKVAAKVALASSRKTERAAARVVARAAAATPEAQAERRAARATWAREWRRRRTMYSRTCLECSGSFVTRSKETKYCSIRCGRIAICRKRRETRIEEMRAMVRRCELCDAPLKLWVRANGRPFFSKYLKRRFCSKRCRLSAEGATVGAEPQRAA